jgi:hypothetical protein
VATSTLLSLLFVPVSYTYFDALPRLAGRLRAAVRRQADRRGPAVAAPPGLVPARPPIAGGSEPPGAGG